MIFHLFIQLRKAFVFQYLEPIIAGAAQGLVVVLAEKRELRENGQINENITARLRNVALIESVNKIHTFGKCVTKLTPNLCHKLYLIIKI